MTLNTVIVNTTTTQNTAEQLIEALEAEGVSFVFGYPGDENLPFVDAVAASDRLRFVLTRHEAAAGFMAAAHGHLTGGLAVAMSTLGAGATNLATPVAHAWLAEMPMLAITGQKPILDNLQGRYQLLDVVEVMRPITKMSATITSPAALPGLIAEAIHVALQYPQGPVHLELPVDIAAQPADIHPLLPIARAPQPEASRDALDEAAQMLAAARRPLVLLGASANARPEVPEAVREFLAHTGIPFICTMMGKGVGDETSPQFLGSAGMPGMGHPHCAVQHSDLVLSVGHNVMEKAPFIMHPDDERQVVHLHDSPATADTIWFPHHQVVGEMAGSLRTLAEQLTPAGGWDLDGWDLGGFAKIHSAAVDAVTAEPDDPMPALVKPQHVARSVRAVMGQQDIVSLDNGIHKLWMTRNYPALAPRTILVDSALGSMGSGVPAAIAAKLIYPDRRVLAVVGDGGFLMTGQEIETAVRLGIDLTVVIFNDGGLGMIRLKQQMDGHVVHGVDFANPDVASYAKAFGATGHRIDDADGLDRVLRGAFESGGVHVIDVPVDYRENAKLMMSMKMLDCDQILGA
ncbi:MAG: acetolactate synthase large subunit [Acidimicrobiales bacterium]